ncbi:MAG: hypothetical protein K8W52_28625 [Deltaproteobacteria bacterium]|nr:hypothetical protein [Deltaproteobacteria bacterium]
MRTSCSVVLLSLVAACGGGASAPDAAFATDATAGDAAPVVDAAPGADAGLRTCADPAGLPVYLNRAGGDYSPGFENPGNNKSSLLSNPVTLLPYGEDDETWQGIVACVADLVAPFHLRVTTVDPGAVDQLEIVVTGSSSTVLGTPNADQISPFTCGTIRSSVHFVLPTETPPLDPHVICQLAAQAIGHAAGIESTPDCSDVMAASIGQPSCSGANGFSNSNLVCGVTSATACQCGGTTRNSFAKMTTAFGACP